MEQEKQQRVWAAGAYAGLTAPKLAKALHTSVDTLKRRVRGEMRPLESEEHLLRQISDVTGLPYEFSTVDFERLPELAPDAELTYVQKAAGSRPSGSTLQSAAGTGADHARRLAEAVAYLQLSFEAEANTAIRDAKERGEPAPDLPDPAAILEELRAQTPRAPEIATSGGASTSRETHDASDVPDDPQLGRDDPQGAQGEDAQATPSGKQRRGE